MRISRRKLTLYATAALAVGLSVPAVAQETGGRNAVPSITEIVVTARRREERLQDVPISISVMNQAQLTKQNIVSGSDLATYIPSLSTNDRFGQDNAAFAIRGFTQELRTTASVGVYFADVVAPRAGQNSVTAGDGAGPGDFFDLENVQVLKGPQGTLFGRNTTGGAILLVPTKPTDKFEGYVQASGGNLDMWRVQAVANLPVNDRLRIRVGIDHNERDGYLKNESGIGPKRQGSVDYTSGRVSIVADLTDTLENYTIFTITDSQATPSIPQAFTCVPPGTFPIPPLTNVVQAMYAANCRAQLARSSGDFYAIAQQMFNPESKINSWRVINKSTWKVNDNFTIKNIFSYSDLKTTLHSAVFATDWHIPSTSPNVGGLPFFFAQSDQVPGFPTSNQKNIVEELQFQGNAYDNKLEWQGGFYYERSSPRSLAGSLAHPNLYCPPNGFPAADPSTWMCQDVVGQYVADFFSLPPGIISIGSANRQLGELEFVNKAVYFQGSYQLIPDLLKLTAGIRYTWDETKSHYQQISYSGFPALSLGGPSSLGCVLSTAMPPDCFTDLRQNSEAPTWLLDLDFTPIDNVLLYAKYSRGYRQGSINPVGAEGFQIHGPEKVDAYEIGAKTSFEGRVPGTFNIAAFYNSLKDQQLQEGFACTTALPPFVCKVNPTTGIVNAGKSRIWGIEVESTISPVDPVTLSVSYTYLNTQLQEIGTITIPPGSLYNLVIPTANAGDDLPLSPHHKVVFTASYRLPVPDRLGDVSLSGTYVYTGKQLTSAGSPFGTIDSYQLANFNLDWKAIGGGPVDASLFVTNAFNEKYATYVPGLFNAIGTEFRNLGYPRMFGGRLQYNF